MTQVTVKIIQRTPTESLHDDDHDLPQAVDIVVNNMIPDEQLADAALDIFHNTIAVKVLDDFDFEVWCEDHELVTLEDHEAYSLSHAGHVL